MSENPLWLAIDGGGTRCRLRLYDHTGLVLGESVSGPANLQLGVDVTFAAIDLALQSLLISTGLSSADLARMYVGLGLAGVVDDADRQRVLNYPHAFAAMAVESDAYTACLGAHSGCDGAVLILGTGSNAVAFTAGRFSSMGGWGFPVSDHGSGAILGLRLVEQALLAHDGCVDSSPLLVRFMGSFNHQPAAVVQWHQKARPGDFASLAPQVFEYAAKGDAQAIQLLQRQTDDIERCLKSLQGRGVERVALMGGLAGPMKPWLDVSYNRLLVEPEGDALFGALLMARNRIQGV